MNPITKQDLIDFESNVARIYETGTLPFLFHLSGGNEDQLLDIFSKISEGDYVISNHRNHYHALLHGIPADKLLSDISSGRSMFVYDRKRNFFTSAILGGTPAIAAGVALALKRKGSAKKVWCFVGDGSEDNGHLYEAARYVDGMDLPCTYIIEDNDRSVDTTKAGRWGANVQPTTARCIQRYTYNITYPHARTPAKVNNLQVPKTDNEYFPVLDTCDAVQSLTGRCILTPRHTNQTTYKESITYAMTSIGSIPEALFVGYNVLNGNAMGSLSNVSDDKKIETPVAENLMTGLSIGLSFEGFRPVVYYERHDFMLNAADAIINHINHIQRISHGEFSCPVILKTVVADAGPFYSGPTHSQDFTNMFKAAVSFPIFDPVTPDEVRAAYSYAINNERDLPTMIVERKSRM